MTEKNDRVRFVSYEPYVLLVVALVVLTISGIHPHDRITWFLEVLPVIIAIPILAGTYRVFRLTPLLYRLILLHAIILMVGGHYTYAQVPLGFWVQDVLDLSRNHYDRLGHFAQGFVPAMLAREILIRHAVLAKNAWLPLIVVCICLAFSAFYELIEWWTALLGGAAADDFLATQGDVWDTQWDMFLALIGAITAQLVLGRRHNQELIALAAR